MKTRFEYDKNLHGLYLLTGWDYFHEFPFGDPPDLELARACWREHREEILADFVPSKRLPVAWAEIEFGPHEREEKK